MASHMMLSKLQPAVLVRNKARVVAYLPSLRAAVRHFRAFSSYDESKPVYGPADREVSVNEPIRNWPDAALGPLNPSDPHFPLPGYVGVHQPQQKQSGAVVSQTSDLFTGMLPYERHAAVFEEYITASKEIDAAASTETEDVTVFDSLECVAQECPQTLKKDMQDLFPNEDLNNKPLTVITIAQRTENDMSAWSPQVEEEREQLLGNFMIGAEEICEALQADGYWADFIDPSSGRPYLGAYTNATLFETDERYRHFGFEIDDLGCCKVIRHHVWGTHAYVGCLVTNAPLSHPALLHLSSK